MVDYEKYASKEELILVGCILSISIAVALGTGDMVLGTCVSSGLLAIASCWAMMNIA
jgi:hypothetical protein